MDHSLLRNAGGKANNLVTPAFNPGQMINPASREVFADQIGRRSSGGSAQGGGGITDDERLMLARQKDATDQANRAAAEQSKAQAAMAAEQLKLAGAKRDYAFENYAKSIDRKVDTDPATGRKAFVEPEDAWRQRKDAERTDRLAKAVEGKEKERKDALTLAAQQADWEADGYKVLTDKERSDKAEAAQMQRSSLKNRLKIEQGADDSALEAMRATAPKEFAGLDAIESELRADDENRTKREAATLKAREARGRLIGAIPEDPVDPLKHAEDIAQLRASENDVGGRMRSLEGEKAKIHGDYAAKLEEANRKVAELQTGGGTLEEFAAAAHGVTLAQADAETEMLGRLNEWHARSAQTEAEFDEIELRRRELDRRATSLNSRPQTDPAVAPVKESARDAKGATIAPTEIKADPAEFTTGEDGTFSKVDPETGTAAPVAKIAIDPDAGTEVAIATNAAGAEQIMRSPKRDVPVYLAESKEKKADAEIAKFEADAKKTQERFATDLDAVRSKAFTDVAEGKATAESAKANMDAAQKGIDEAFRKASEPLQKAVTESVTDFATGKISAQQFERVWKAGGMEGSAVAAFQQMETEAEKDNAAFVELVAAQRKEPSNVTIPGLKLADGRRAAGDYIGFDKPQEFFAAYEAWKADPKTADTLVPGAKATFEKLFEDRIKFEDAQRAKLAERGIVGDEANDLIRRAQFEGYRSRERDTRDWAAEFRMAELVPFVAGIAEAYDMKPLAETALKLEKGETVTEEESNALEEFIVESGRENTSGTMFWSILAGLPAFGGEMAASAGLYGVGKKVATKVALEALERVTKKSAVALLKKKAGDTLGKRAARWGARSMIKGAGAAVGTAFRLPVASATRIPAGALREMATQGFEGGKLALTEDEIGDFEIAVHEDQPGIDPVRAFTQAGVDNYVELLSEVSGGGFGRIAEPFRKMALKGAVFRALRTINGGKTFGDVRRFAKKVGWNGMIGESLEERFGEALRGGIDVATDGYVGEEWKMPTLKQIGVELMAFAAPGLGFGLASEANRIRIERPLKAKIAAAEGRFSQFTGGTIDDITTAANARAKSVDPNFPDLTPAEVQTGMDLTGGSFERLPGVAAIDRQLELTRTALEAARETGNSSAIINNQEIIANLTEARTDAAIMDIAGASVVQGRLAQMRADVMAQGLDPVNQQIAMAPIEALSAAFRVATGSTIQELPQVEQNAIQIPLPSGAFPIDATDAEKPIIADEIRQMAEAEFGPEIARQFIRGTEAETRQRFNAPAPVAPQQQSPAQAPATTQTPAPAPQTQQPSSAKPATSQTTAPPATPAATVSVTAKTRSGKTIARTFPKGTKRSAIEAGLWEKALADGVSPNDFLDPSTITITDTGGPAATQKPAEKAKPAAATAEKAEKGKPDAKDMRKRLDKALVQKLSKARAAGIKIRFDPKLWRVAEATDTEITLNVAKFIEEATKAGLEGNEFEAWVSRVFDEEMKHIAVYRALRARFDKGTGVNAGESFAAFSDRTMEEIWTRDFAGTPLETQITELYNAEGVAKSALGHEAVRMVLQQMTTGEITEEVQTWIKSISDELRTFLKEALRAIAEFAKTGNLSMKSEELNAIIKDSLAILNGAETVAPATSESKPAEAQAPATSEVKTDAVTDDAAPSVTPKPAAKAKEPKPAAPVDADKARLTEMERLKIGKEPIKAFIARQRKAGFTEVKTDAEGNRQLWNPVLNAGLPENGFSERGREILDVATFAATGVLPPAREAQAAEVALEEARAAVDTNPTEAQKEAGNYAKGHVTIQGLDITIENPKGSERSGTDKGGKAWSVTMANDYGYFKRTEGKDGDHIDTFIGPNLASEKVFVVNQTKQGGGNAFDEHKVMLGFDTREEAKAAYAANYSPGWKVGPIAETTIAEFKGWMETGDTTKPFFSASPAEAAKPAPEKAAEPARHRFKKGDRVRFQWNGETLEGEVVNRGRLNSEPKGPLVYAIQYEREKGKGPIIQGGVLESDVSEAPEAPAKPAIAFTQSQRVKADWAGSTVEGSLVIYNNGRTAIKSDGVEITVPASSLVALEPPNPDIQVVETPKTPKTPNKAKGKKAADLLARQLAAYFTPGAVVPSYGGGWDRVIEFLPGTETESWRVRVIAVNEDGSDITGERAREHMTLPDRRDLERALAQEEAKTTAKETPVTASPAPTITAADKAIFDILDEILARDGIGAALLAGQRFDRALPREFRNRILDGMEPWLASGVRDAPTLAAKLLSVNVAYVQFTDALYSSMRMENPSLPSLPNMDAWQSVYDSIPLDAKPGSEQNKGEDETESPVQGEDTQGEQEAGGSGDFRRPSGESQSGEDVGDGVPEADGSGSADSPATGKRPKRSGVGSGGKATKANGTKAGGNEEGTDPIRPGDGSEVLPSPRRSPGRRNYFLSDPEAIVGGGPKARFARNRKALETLETIQVEDREPTPEELDALAAYTGWGAFGQELFQGSWERGRPKEDWIEEDQWLRDRLGEASWKSAQHSILNAHYTDPPTVSIMWDMLDRMGFRGGRTLEPSEGTGNFWSLMPPEMAENSSMTGIELDRVTHEIAKMLHPETNHFRNGYEESSTPDNFYDLVIGNWPFDQNGPSDRRYNALNLSLHDYFFAKAIDQTRPGGIVMGITSSGTMDKKGAAARRYLASRGELIAAFRLPTGAFGKYAGTKVVTDIIILRKRETPLEDVSGEKWINSVDDPQGRDFRYNEYYHANPSHILGTIDYGHGTTFGRAGMVVHRQDNFPEELARLAERVPSDGFRKWTPPNGKAHTIANTTAVKRQNSLVIEGNELYRVAGEQLELADDLKKWKVSDPKTSARRMDEFRMLIDIRDRHSVLMDAYQKGGDTGKAREELRAAYDSFKKKFKGAISDSAMLKVMAKLGDPGALVLENIEDEKGKPRAILTKDIMRPAAPNAAGSVEDAYAIQRNNSLIFSLDEVAELSGKSVDDVRATLIELGQIFQTPLGVWESRDEYLAGNVRRKLREAQASAQQGIEGMDRNIEELKKIQPETTHYSEIEVRMGASWIDKKDYRDFFNTLLQVPEEHSATTEVVKQATGWKIKIDPRYSRSNLAQTRWGISLLPFASISGAAMNGTSVTVRWKDEDGVSHVDVEQTKAANSKVEEIRAEFQSWIWKDADRTARLAFEYNEAMNSTVTPQRNGSHLRLEGLALTLGNSEFDFRKHQRDAVWRFLQDGRGMGFHEVGTGKTFTMAGLCLEGRRLGRFRKPLLFAHNANHETVAAEFRIAYPAAKILHFDSIGKEDRDSKFRQMQLDEWDAIIVPHSLIEKFTLKEESMNLLVAKQIQALEDEFWAEVEELPDVDASSIDLDDMESVGRAFAHKAGAATAKELAKARERIKLRIKRKIDKLPADAIFFEDLGVDALLVDEAHIFKKISLATRKKIKGLQTQESGTGFSLTLLTDHLKMNNNGRGVFTFTGTPVTNSLNEVFNMMHYVMSDQMEDAGINSFDDWFNTFADTSNEIELTSGNTYEPVERLLAFINVPELAQLASRSFDVVLAADMPEFVPRDSPDGMTENPVGRPFKKMEIVISEMSPEQAAHKEGIKTRYKAFQALDGKSKLEQMRSGGDSPLIMEGEGSNAALDMRLVNPDAPDFSGSKVNFAVRNILAHYNENEKSTQMVFLERGWNDYTDRTKPTKSADGRKLTTPEGKVITTKQRVRQFNLVRDMVEKLVSDGVRPEEIAIFSNMTLDPASERPDDVMRKVQKVTSSIGKEELSVMMREGKIRVAFGSSESMGTGVNAQTYLRAMHHLDAPWMPGHLEQRNGRGHRQGNKWNTVLEYRYFTEGSHDGRRWQILLNKVRFIYRFTDMLRGKGKLQRVLEGDGADTDESGGIGDFEESFSAAAGDPRLLLRANIQKTIDRLESRRDTHLRNQEEARRAIDSAKRQEVDSRGQIERLNADIAAYESVKELPFSVTVYDGKNSKVLENREDVKAFWERLPTQARGVEQTVGNFHGFSIRQTNNGWMTMKEVISPAGNAYTLAELSMGSVEGVLRNLRNRVKNIQEQVEASTQSIPQMEELISKPFSREDDLNRKKEALEKIVTELRLSPVPAPGWLRHGVPSGSMVYVDGKALDVMAHRWDENGYWVIIEEDDGTMRPYRYDELNDEEGNRIFSDREFVPPKTEKKASGDAPGPEEGRSPLAAANLTNQRLAGMEKQRAAMAAAGKDTAKIDAKIAEISKPLGAGNLITPDGANPDDVAAIDAALAELGNTESTAAWLEGLRAYGQSEPPGQRTAANPAIANPGRDDAARRDFDAVRIGYEGILEHERESHEEWIAEAERRLAEDRAGTIREILELMQAGGTPVAWQVKAARLVVNDIRREAYATNDRELHRVADTLSMGYMRMGSDQARAFAARADDFRNPEERHLEMIGHLIAYLPERQERVIRKLPSAAEKNRLITSLQADLAEAKKGGAKNRETIARLQRELTAAKASASSEEARNKALEERQEKIRSILTKSYGVTLEEIFNGEAVVHLRGSKVVQKVIERNFSGAEARAIRMVIDGDGNRAAGSATGLTREQVEKAYQRFLKLLERRLTELVKQGINLNSFTAGDIMEGIEEAQTALGAANLTPAQVQATVAAMMSTFNLPATVRNSGRVKKINSKSTPAKTRKGKVLPGKRIDVSDRAQVMQLARTLQSNLEANAFDMIYEWFINSILSGPLTHIVNTTGNLANTMFEYGLQRPLEAAFNSLFLGDPGGHSLSERHYLKRGFSGLVGRAYARAAETWATEMSFFDTDYLNDPVMTLRQAEDKIGGRLPAIPGTTGKIVRIPGRALMFADTFFKEMIAGVEVWAQAYRIGKLKGLHGAAMESFIKSQLVPGSAAWLGAAREAERLTFTDRLRSWEDGGGGLESLAKWVMDLKSSKRLGPFWTAVLGMFVPFIQTPFRIFQAGLRRTPLGLLGIAAVYSRGLFAMRDGVPFFESVPRARIARDLADQTISLGLAASLIYASEGDGGDDDDKWLLITGTHPYGLEKSGERDATGRINGGPMMIRFGTRQDGFSIDYSRIEPAATTLATTVDFIRGMKRINRGKPAGEEMKNLIHYAAAQAGEKTFLKGLTSIFEFMKDPEAGSGPAKFLASFVPNIIKQPLRNLDDYARDYKTAPWYYHFLPVGSFASQKIDVFGEEVRKGEITGTDLDSLLRQFIDVGERRPNDTIQPADAAMRQYDTENPGMGYFPSGNRLNRFRTESGEMDGEMTPEEFELVNRIGGETFARESAAALSPLDVTAPVEDTRNRVEDARRGPFTKARDSLFPGGSRPYIPKKTRSITEAFGIE